MSRRSPRENGAGGRILTSFRYGFFLVLAMSAFGTPGYAGQPTSPIPLSGNEIETGFNLLYQLKFAEAREQFLRWGQARPDDPMGHVSLAASYLFEELCAQGVLTSEYFLNDKRFLEGIEGAPDPALTGRFTEANTRARNLARKLLEANSRDADALLALTISSGMQSNFESILHKRQMEGLRHVREAEGFASRLLRLRPDAADAWLAIGAANYIVGSLPRHFRFFLWFGGYRGDRRRGMEQLTIAAEKGRYLRPFAKIILGLAALREKQSDVARRQFADLTAEFRDNHLFAIELANIEKRASPVESSRD